MKAARLLLLLPLVSAAHALGFADGVKIGEVTDTSAVLWARLTRDAEPGNRVAEWTAEAPNWTVPGANGVVEFRWWKAGDEEEPAAVAPAEVRGDTDHCIQTALTGLEPATAYEFEIGGTAGGESAAITGSFTTAPAADSEEPVVFAVSTCQEFERRDDSENGHRIYNSMLALGPAFFLQTGDTVYYDRHAPLAKNMALARYRWNRMYALPFQKEFHRRIPTCWMHDDHDILKDDAWPGQTYGDLTWDQGLEVWREQVPQAEKPYRTYRWGKHLQIWLPEGREYRSPNTMPDGPEKSILGKEQWKWLEETMAASDATFKLYVSATPVVGPDRKGKRDNHANEGFDHEGEKLRKFLSAFPGCFVINGDRHWQYHSVDPETGLDEFGCGPASDSHAQGWNTKDQRPEHEFLRVKGGFATIRVTAEAATVTHHAVDGEPVHETRIAAPE